MIGIGFFQLQNLVHQRVPFFLVHNGTDLNSLRSQFNQPQWAPSEINVKSLSELQSELAAKCADKSSPLVVMCAEPLLTIEWAQQIRSLGYINVFHVAEEQ